MPAHILPEISRRAFLQAGTMGAAAFLFGTARAQAAPAPFHLALMSDTHIPADRTTGSRGYNACDHLQLVTPDVLAAKPEGLIICGDAAQSIGEAGDYVTLFELLKPLTDAMPTYIAMGNHDDRVNFYDIVKKLDGDVQPIQEQHVTVLEHDYVRIVLLDSLMYVRKRGGHLGSAQREWLTAYLTENTDKPVALMLHHTLGPGDNDLLDTELFFDLLAPHKHVQAIFHGHSHRWVRYERQGIPIINLPTMAHIWTPDQPLGWVDAQFHKTGMDLTLRAFAGNREEDGKTFSYAWS